MMSLDLKYRNAHWLIIKNIKNYICPRKSKLPPERYKQHPYIHIYNNPKRIKSGRRHMCLKSPELRSTDNIKFDSDSVDVFLDTCVIAGATPFKNDFLPNTFFPTIENMEGQGGNQQFTATVPSHITYIQITDQRSPLRLTISPLLQI